MNTLHVIDGCNSSLNKLSIENNTGVLNTRNTSDISEQPCMFLLIMQSTVLSSILKYSQAMIDSWLIISHVRL